MIALSRLCLRCGKMAQVERGRCPDCGSQLEIESENNHFLSGPLMKGGKAVTLPPGTILLERFRIAHHINNGRYGSVYLAEDMLCSMQVALKVTDVGSQSEELAALQLQREKAIYNRIQNFRHVIKIYDLHFVPWGGTGLLVLSMEYANGDTFRKWLMDRRKDREARQTAGMEYFKQACWGVGDGHQGDVIHHDLKPENFLFLDGVLKVSDFGGATCAQMLQKMSGFFCETLPSEFGTPVYMSPEHFIAFHLDDLDERSDIYSLGVILFEILNPKGRPPFAGPYERLRKMHLEVPAPRLQEAGKKFAGVIAKCLEKDPANRYQSVAGLLDDLEERSGNKPSRGIPLKASTEELSRELEETWEKASLLFSQNDFNKAFRLTEKVLAAQPDHPGAQQLKDELSTRFSQSEQLYQEIDRSLNGGDLSELVALLQEAISIYPEHPAGRLVQIKLGARARQYRAAMEEGLRALEEERWGTALECFRQALRLHPGAKSLMEIIEPLNKIADLRQEIHRAIAQGESRKALRQARLVDLLIEKI